MPSDPMSRVGMFSLAVLHADGRDHANAAGQPFGKTHDFTFCILVPCHRGCKDVILQFASQQADPNEVGEYLERIELPADSPWRGMA
eukprot:scaffold74050_cov37-Tisochrysis_lutea.AAC.8